MEAKVKARRTGRVGVHVLDIVEPQGACRLGQEEAVGCEVKEWAMDFSKKYF
jgi:hypothetical protein